MAKKMELSRRGVMRSLRSFANFFDAATRVVAERGGVGGYAIDVVTPGGGAVALSNGLRLSAGPLPRIPS